MFHISSSYGLVQSFKRVLIFGCFGLGLSPILHRLTDTISTDTIYTTSALMLLVHLVTHDYSQGSASALSLNAGLFAAVCLASRLSNSFDGFVLLSFSVQVFALLPMARGQLQSSTRNSVVVTAVLGSLVMAVCNAVISSSVCYAASATLLTIVVICPVLFLHWQSYKDTIHGPWDEAVPSYES